MAWTEDRGRAAVKARATGVCEICGCHLGESWSHRLSAGRGGTWRPSNGLWSCGDGTVGCHGWLEANPTWAGDGGWHLRRNPADPALAPVFLRPAMAWPAWWLIPDDALGLYVAADPADYGLPEVPEHLPPNLAAVLGDRPRFGRPVATTPWVDPR